MARSALARNRQAKLTDGVRQSMPLGGQIHCTRRCKVAIDALRAAAN